MGKWIPAVSAMLAAIAMVVWAVTPARKSASTVSDDAATVAAGSEALVAVQLPAELSDQAAIGKRAFEAKCASCHGANAAGQNGVAPPLVHKIYEPSHHGDYAFERAAKQGVRAHHWRFGDMPPVEGISRAEVAAITRYVRELQRANGIL